MAYNLLKGLNGFLNALWGLFRTSSYAWDRAILSSFVLSVKGILNTLIFCSENGV